MKVEQKAEFDTDISIVWSIITDNTNHEWRKDIQSIEVMDDTNFIETDIKGYQVHFTIIEKEVNKNNKFKINGENISGIWTGIFKSTGENKTEVRFIEDVSTNNIIMKLFLKSYLKKQQDNYIKYLREYILLTNKKEVITSS